MKSPCGNLISWGISPDFSGLSPCYRQIAYALLTRAPVAAKSIATLALPLDLHVLGLSLAFILSQDQTLRCIALFFSLYLRRSPGRNRRSLSIVLHLLLSNIFNDLRPSPNTGPKARSLGESVAKVHPFPAYLQIFYHLFFEKFLKISGTFTQPFYFLYVIIHYPICHFYTKPFPAISKKGFDLFHIQIASQFIAI